MPTALTRALESTSLKDAVRNAVSLGGDADTVAAIAGAIGRGAARTARRARQDRQRAVPAGRGGHHWEALDGLYERATCELTPETHRYESDRMG